MTTHLEIALGYRRRGWAVTPVIYRSKKAMLKNWSKHVLSVDEVRQSFGSEHLNIGVLNGKPSGDLVDIDLDCREANFLAEKILPPTAAIFGRASKPRSHLLYTSQLKTQQFRHPVTRATLLEARSTGTQTVFPGSVHPSGEQIVWAAGGSPVEVERAILEIALGKLAAACLLATCWAGPGGRHDLSLTVIGWLMRSGWSPDATAAFVAHVVAAAGGDADLEKRIATATDTATRLAEGRTVRGFTAIVGAFGRPVATTAAKWLGIETKPASKTSPMAKSTISSNADATTEPAAPKFRLGSDVEIANVAVATLKQEFDEVIFADGKVYAFKTTHWFEIEADHLRALVRGYDGAEVQAGKSVDLVKLNKRRIDSIIFETCSIMARPNFFDATPVGINCMSGFIVIDNNGEVRVEAHHPNHRQRHVLPGRYPVQITDVRRTGSSLHRLLEGCFHGDDDAEEKTQLCAEVAASGVMGIATLIREPRAVVFYGPEAENGKSQLLELYRGLVLTGTAAVPVSRFDDDKHVLRLIGKPLNAVDELGDSKRIASDRFKAVVTGDPILGRNVYSTTVEFRPRTQHVFATNKLPRFDGGMDRGVRRRLHLLPFNRVIPKSERIEFIGKRAAEDDPDLVLDWVVDGARRLMKNRTFTMPASSLSGLKEWLHVGDVVLAWLEDDTELEPGARLLVGAARRSFLRWAIAAGHREGDLPDVEQFAQRVYAAGRGIGRWRDNSARYFVGVRLRSGLPPDPGDGGDGTS